ncbi:SecY-interacting protein [Motiliproteus sp. MSK22-1]|uniref:SecY-interacting protein n=1 Tax=Motiliproteus sp. MSK22-1 TaxID=1897630 RepID=UPI000975C362|nr:SecY-interacting protein [Motiliproteus sp. MSK22-1]OMH25927.1 hypothetical protein BGP75_25815 [Motiliproteus sp. MSK22-1]
MPSAVEQALDQLINLYLDQYQNDETALPVIAYDEDWPSACYQESPDVESNSPWKPILQDKPTDLFERLEDALEFKIHTDIKQYYSRYWSDSIPASFNGDHLSLLFVWNDSDYERLRGNLIGHCLSKRKAKSPPTFFFACTEPDELILSIENDSGRILLEEPGKPPIREIAPSLDVFLSQLKPRRGQ